ncbi:hypothetical protein NQ314_020074 [Rhamnusium bicolor]|uniref:Uncharacterized protein n=1 Tax=Rhamnusium bicolor TaxID=1586634 RepID=A0AAV8WMW0_9CUCU|nr:hypothetical protein NQ314_020074 [Rhamnusium bicolor]
MFCFNVNFCGKVKQNNSDFNIYQGSMENFPTELTEFLVINVPNDNEEASTSTQRAVKTYTEWTPNATRSNQINVENIEPEPSPEEASTEIIVQKEKEAYKEKKKCMINVSRKRTSSSSSKTRAKNPTFCRTFTSK